LLSYFGHQLEVSAFEDHCVLTLPLRTLDDRYLDIHVEDKIGDLKLVHDGGRTTAELFAQGIHLTDSREAQLRAIAGKYGVSYNDGTFTQACRADSIQQTVFAIAQCASLAMYDVLSHSPKVEAEPVASIVRRTLDQWRPPDVDLRHLFHFKGQTAGADHVFDSVAFPKVSGRHAVAVKTLAPGYGPQVQADRYGFLVLDIRGTEYDKWPRIAVISKADQWPSGALEMVRSLSTRTLEADTGNDAFLERTLPHTMVELAA
jgi:hypothetical protein